MRVGLALAAHNRRGEQHEHGRQRKPRHCALASYSVETFIEVKENRALHPVRGATDGRGT